MEGYDFPIGPKLPPPPPPIPFHTRPKTHPVHSELEAEGPIVLGGYDPLMHLELPLPSEETPSPIVPSTPSSTDLPYHDPSSPNLDAVNHFLYELNDKHPDEPTVVLKLAHHEPPTFTKGPLVVIQFISMVYFVAVLVMARNNRLFEPFERKFLSVAGTSILGYSSTPILPRPPRYIKTPTTVSTEIGTFFARNQSSLDSTNTTSHNPNPTDKCWQIPS